MASTKAQVTGANMAGLAETNNIVAESIFKQMSTEKNLFISPLSISTALAMLYCGARGQAAEEMAQVMGYKSSGLHLQNVPDLFQEYSSMLNNNPKAYALASANAMMLQKNFYVKDAYKSLLKKKFQGNVFEVDFAQKMDKTLEKINAWTKENTKGMISKLIDELGSDTVILLLNAIYFKGQWLHQFDKKATHSHSFHNNGIKKQVKNIDMMHLKDRFKYIEEKTFQAIELPYEGDEIAMLIFLPKSIDGLGKLIKNFSNNHIKDVRKKMWEMKVEVYLPKFKLEYKNCLIGPLKALGMTEIFKLGVDLGGMSDCRVLEVTEVIHKAVIEVNEEGSEASGVTAIAIALRCLVVDPIFKADHPFLFTIYDTKNELCLFIGKVDEL